MHGRRAVRGNPKEKVCIDTRIDLLRNRIFILSYGNALEYTVITAKMEQAEKT